jgi:hypothetical protein
MCGKTFSISSRFVMRSAESLPTADTTRSVKYAICEIWGLIGRNLQKPCRRWHNVDPSYLGPSAPTPHAPAIPKPGRIFSPTHPARPPKAQSSCWTAAPSPRDPATPQPSYAPWRRALNPSPNRHPTSPEGLRPRNPGAAPNKATHC